MGGAVKITRADMSVKDLRVCSKAEQRWTRRASNTRNSVGA